MSLGPALGFFIAESTLIWGNIFGAGFRMGVKPSAVTPRLRPQRYWKCANLRRVTAQALGLGLERRLSRQPDAGDSIPVVASLSPKPRSTEGR